MTARYDIPKGRTVTDSLAVPVAIAGGTNTLLVAPPGSGKSDAVISELIRTEVPFVYVASVKPEADEVGKRYSLPVYHKGTNYQDGSQVVTVPYHLTRSLGARPDSVLVIAGTSWLASDYAFRAEDVEATVRYLGGAEYRQVIVLEDLFETTTNPWEIRTDLLGLKLDRVEIHTQTMAVEVELVSYTDMKTAILDSVNAHPARSHLISLFNKSDLAKSLVEMLESRGLKKARPTVLNSTEGDRDYTTDKLEGRLGGIATEVVVSTYRLGLSVARGNQVLHVVPYALAKHSVLDVVQLVGQFRSATSPPVIRLYNNFPEAAPKFSSIASYEHRLRVEATRRIGRHRDHFGANLDDESHEEIKAIEQSNLGGNRPPDQINLVKPDLSVNELQIWHNVVRRHTDEAYASPSHLERVLGGYGLTLVRGERHERIEKAPSLEAALREQEFLTEVGRCFAGELTAHPQVAHMVHYLLQHFEPSDARALLEKYGFKRWKSVTRRIDALRPNDKLGRELLREMRSAFASGDKVDGPTINSRINAILRNIRLTAKENMSPQRTTRLMRLYFDIHRKRSRTADSGNVFQIRSDHPLPFPFKNSQN